ncbi:MAG: hypothetical protein ACRDRV_14510 [Pseudonocardiaceae bacterium]
MTTWTGGTERALVVDGYTWTVLPGTDYEMRVLTVRPLALRYRPRGGMPSTARTAQRSAALKARGCG